MVWWLNVAGLKTGVARGLVGPLLSLRLSRRQGVSPFISWLPSTLVGDGFCHILNLRGLNTFFQVAKFRMQPLTSILQGLHTDWWMVSLDLKDAYLYVTVHPSHWRYLQFALRNQAGELIVYQWKVPLLTEPLPPCFLPNS